MRKIIIIGKDGQIGTELQRSLAPLGAVHAVGHQQLDLTQPQQITALLNDSNPNIIVNAAAYTDVDAAESNSSTAHAVNADAVAVLAQHAQQSGALLVHYSTDYIFDGTQRTPYSESDQPNPQNVYGQSKLAGEQAITAADGAHLIFRTSWVYAAQGNNFLRTMMRLAMQREQLSVVDDQIGAPTSAALIANLTALAIWARGRGLMETGTYHLAAAGQTSWHGFAKHIVEQMVALGMQPRVQPDNVIAIDSASYPTPATRPAYSLLNCNKLETALGLTLPDWKPMANLAVQQSENRLG